MKKLLIIAVVGSLLMPVFPTHAKEKLVLVHSFTSSGGRSNFTDQYIEKNETQFTLDESIKYFVSVTLENINKRGGKYKMLAKWYSNGQQVSAFKSKHKLGNNDLPHSLWSKIDAAGLGYGNHKVEIFIDGTIFDTREFSVVRELCEAPCSCP